MRHTAGAIVVVRCFDGGDGLADQSLPGAVALPEFGGRREFSGHQRSFGCRRIAGSTLKQEAVTVAGEDERNVHQLGIV